jgi:hypothetical protein
MIYKIVFFFEQCYHGPRTRNAISDVVSEESENRKIGMCVLTKSIIPHSIEFRVSI